MVRQLILLLIGLFYVDAESSVPVTVIPPVVMSSFEVMLAASSLAASAGLITIGQKEEFQSKINDFKTQISMQFKKKQGPKVAANVPERQFPTSKSDERGSILVESQTVFRREECDKNQRPKARDCCKNWLEQMEHQDLNSKIYLVEISENAFQIQNHLGETVCCLEWDSVHGRFEVFKNGGNGVYPPDLSGEPYTHLGEFSCEGENKIKNPCELSAIELFNKADNSGKHAPRQGCEGKVKIHPKPQVIKQKPSTR